LLSSSFKNSFVRRRRKQYAYVFFKNTQFKVMENNTSFVIDAETINKVGLRLSIKQINAQIAQNARIFEYPHLADVFVMENDLYGNPMPEGSCFLAFNSSHGLIGKHLKIETLKEASVEDIKRIVEKHSGGVAMGAR
jgi:hypothetical protein